MKLDKIVLIRHRVANFRKWKDAFAAAGPTRRAHGCKGGYLFRNVDNPKEIVVILRWDDPARARQFATSEDLREMMARAGVSDLPDVYLLNEFDTIIE
jgi:quinol monooxygenase YgiN